MAKRQQQKLKPKEPEPIKVTAPSFTKLPYEAPDMGKYTPTWTEKPVIKSRTIVWLVIGFAGVALRLFGIDLELAQFSEDGVLTLMEIITIVAMALAVYFRKNATGPLSGIFKDPELG